MFHHFHDDFHKKSQGSIDEKSFNMIIDYLESKYDILPPDLYIQRFESKTQLVEIYALLLMIL